MAMRGRRRKLDDVKRGQVCALVASGCGLELAARYVGCSIHTLRRELARHPEFREKLRGAEVQLELEPLRAMKVAAGRHWRAAAWLLERTHPRRFAPRKPDALQPEDFERAMLEVIETATEIVADPKQRGEICRGLLAAAKSVAANLTPAAATAPFNAEERQFQNFLDEIDRTQRDGRRFLKRKFTRSSPPAEPKDAEGSADGVTDSNSSIPRTAAEYMAKWGPHGTWWNRPGGPPSPWGETVTDISAPDG